MRSRILSLSSLALSFASMLLLSVRPVRASFTIEPAVITFFADRGEKTAFVEVVHTGGGPAAIQLSVYERLLDVDGGFIKEKLPVASEFLVHPAQVILYPKERATVQIQYKGKRKVSADKAYVLYSQEVPINVRPDDEGVKMAVKMLTSYYTVIALETGKPGKLVFVSSKVLGGGKIEVLAENKGSGRVRMDALNLVIDGKRVGQMTGRGNSIMPGQTRRFTFEYPRAVTAKEVKFVY